MMIFDHRLDNQLRFYMVFLRYYINFEVIRTYVNQFRSAQKTNEFISNAGNSGSLRKTGHWESPGVFEIRGNLYIRDNGTSNKYHSS